jgi:hypothetical protein
MHTGGCLFNNDGVSDPEVWAQRRHISKVHELAQNFAAVYGPDSLNTQLRPVYADWTIYPARFNATLAWFNRTYSFPGTFLYGMAATGYFVGDAKALGPTPALEDIYASYRNDSDSQLGLRTQLAQVAAAWGLKLVAYEAGPGWNVGETTGVGAWILAQRFAEMRQVIKYDVETSWAAAGGGTYNAFSLTGQYSRYGQWGFTENTFNLTTPKYCALLDMTQPPGSLPEGCRGW